MPVELVKGVSVDITSGGEVCVKGADGRSLRVWVKPVINVEVKDGKVVLTRQNDEPQTRAWHGLYRKLIYNAVVGLSTGWSKVLVMKGVGYKASVSGNILELHLGYSRPVKMEIPKDIKVKVEKSNLKVSGMDRAEVGEFCARIRKLREPEPYLGKGIRYSDEVIRRKAGKSGGEKGK